MSLHQLPPEITSSILDKLDRIEDVISYSKVNKYSRAFCRKRKQELLRKYTISPYNVKYKKSSVVQLIDGNATFVNSHSCPLCLSVYTTSRDRPAPARGCIKNCADCKRSMCTNIKLQNYCYKEPINDGESNSRIKIITYRCGTCRRYDKFGIWTPRLFTKEEEEMKALLRK